MKMSKEEQKKILDSCPVCGKIYSCSVQSTCKGISCDNCIAQITSADSLCQHTHHMDNIKELIELHTRIQELEDENIKLRNFINSTETYIYR